MSMSQAAMQLCCFGLFLCIIFLHAFKLKACIIKYELLGKKTLIQNKADKM